MQQPSNQRRPILRLEDGSSNRENKSKRPPLIPAAILVNETERTELSVEPVRWAKIVQAQSLSSIQN